MSETLIIPETSVSKKEKYEILIPQIEALVSGETDLIANLANISAALHYGMGFFWVGFYLVQHDELVLGPFQGPIACTRIRKGKGVCGASWEQGKGIIVENVDEFPGHIACSSDSKSEIVLPIFKDGKVALIMDVDSEKLADFDDTDALWLQKIVQLIEKMA